MTNEDLKGKVLEHLARVAPEADIVAIEPEVNFRDQFEFDSIDFLNFVLGLEKDVGVRVPEYDYPKLSNLDACLTYLQEAMASAAG